jgi:hypothetical protein
MSEINLNLLQDENSNPWRVVVVQGLVKDPTNPLADPTGYAPNVRTANLGDTPNDPDFKLKGSKFFALLMSGFEIVQTIGGKNYTFDTASDDVNDTVFENDQRAVYRAVDKALKEKKYELVGDDYNPIGQPTVFVHDCILIDRGIIGSWYSESVPNYYASRRNPETQKMGKIYPWRKIDGVWSKDNNPLILNTLQYFVHKSENATVVSKAEYARRVEKNLVSGVSKPSDTISLDEKGNPTTETTHEDVKTTPTVEKPTVAMPIRPKATGTV